VRVSSRFISAVALYGPKAEPFRGLLADVQDTIGTYPGFQPYTLEQVHATLIAFNGVRAGAGHALVNEYFLENTGERREMDIGRAMEILTTFFATPLRVRIGGYRPDDPVPFLSRGQHLHDRTFSVQGDAFVLIGWPVATGLPLDRLRRDLNAAGLLHRYHRKPADVDGDMHIVIGHHHDAPRETLDRAVRAIRRKLATSPVTFDITAADVRVVAADSHTLAPPLFSSPIPVEADIVRALVEPPDDQTGSVVPVM
jgi:hypothetical protein